MMSSGLQMVSPMPMSARPVIAQMSPAGTLSTGTREKLLKTNTSASLPVLGFSVSAGNDSVSSASQGSRREEQTEPRLNASILLAPFIHRQFSNEKVTAETEQKVLKLSTWLCDGHGLPFLEPARRDATNRKPALVGVVIQVAHHHLQ